jgi:signal transduction histidine kinase
VTDRTRAAVVRWVVIAGMFAWLFGVIVLHWGSPGSMPGVTKDGGVPAFVAVSILNIAINLLYFGAAYHFGDKAWAGAKARAALDARTRELEAERARSAAQAVALDRVRIARELHDVVAHHVSVMGVQAGAARRVLGADPAQASASLEAVEASARTAVEELGRMLGTLRSDDSADPADPADRTGTGEVDGALDGRPTSAGPAAESPSTRGVDRLPDLVADADAVGHPARLTVVGTARVLPPTVEVVAYRIAQEAVTNTLKHAGPDAAIDIRLRYLADGIELEVADSGRGGRGAGRSGVAGGSGLGHVGMRERVAAVGGTVDVGPRTRGGYLVRAWIPA